MAANSTLLDELMGAHRDALPGERGADDVEWKDSDVSRIVYAVVYLFNTLTEIRLRPRAHYNGPTLSSLYAFFFCPFRSVKTFCAVFVRRNCLQILGPTLVSTVRLSSVV